MAEMPKPIREALYRLGACTGIAIKRTREGGGRLIVRGVGETEEIIGFTASEADVFSEAYDQIKEALVGETTLLPEEVEERVNLTRRHVYGTVYEAARKKWTNK